MSEETIISNIERRVRANYPVWSVGLTDDPNRLEKVFESRGERTTWFLSWRAGSVESARNVMRFFAERGCQPADPAGGRPTFVYIY